MLPRLPRRWARSAVRPPAHTGKYAEIADFLGLKGTTDKEKLESLIRAIGELKEKVGIKDHQGLQHCRKDFLESLDEMAEQAFDDQCTGTNPRYPLISEIKQMYLDAYYGKEQKATEHVPAEAAGIMPMQTEGGNMKLKSA